MVKDKKYQWTEGQQKSKGYSNWGYERTSYPSFYIGDFSIEGRYYSSSYFYDRAQELRWTFHSLSLLDCPRHFDYRDNSSQKNSRKCKKMTKRQEVINLLSGSFSWQKSCQNLLKQIKSEQKLNKKKYLFEKMIEKVQEGDSKSMKNQQIEQNECQLFFECKCLKKGIIFD